MKNRFTKATVLVLMLSILVLSLTGCDALDYRKAVDQYNAENFDTAAQMFSALGDYEDSRELVTRSHYWAAVTRMEAGNYEEALPRFLKLGDYEDSAQRAVECKYMQAVAAFTAGDLAEAEVLFLEQPEYKQTPEYLRQITWQKFFEAVKAAGHESDTGITLQKEQNGRVFSITAVPSEPNALVFSASNTKDMGYVFYDDLALTLTRDSLEAEFTATGSFTMDYLGNEIGSRQTASGKVDISVCTAETVLSVDAFEMTVTDNKGNTSTSTDPADSLMAQDMAQNLAALLDSIPQILAKAEIALTLYDIGFAAL